MVEFLNHKKFSANIVGIDTDMDLCLLKISVNEQLPFMPIGDSDAMDAGSHVLAIGNPLGLKHTVTSGIISFKHRIMSMSGFEDFLQTDAAINPGNSGGALMNMRGELVGINTAIMRDATGLGFAIPSNTVAQVIAQFKATGKYTHPWLGIVMQYLSSDLAEQFKATEGEGVLVSEVLEGSPAGDVGIQAGDVIVSKSDDAEPFSEPVFVSVMVHKHNVGDKINFVVLRNQVKLHFSVTLKPRPEEKKVENEQVPH